MVDIIACRHIDIPNRLSAVPAQKADRTASLDARLLPLLRRRPINLQSSLSLREAKRTAILKISRGFEV